MLQSFSSLKPRKRMAYFHPFRPFVLWTLGFSASSPFGKSFHLPNHPLVHFRATQAACPHACRAFTDGLGRLADHPQNAPRIRSSAFQHIRIGKPFFHSLFPENVWKTLPCFPNAPRLGLATHTAVGSLSLPTLGNLFQLPTLLGFTLQSFFPFE